MDPRNPNRKPPVAGSDRPATDRGPAAAGGRGLHSGPVPHDVQRALALKGNTLPEYFDAELARQVEQARRNWPLLRGAGELGQGERA